MTRKVHTAIFRAASTLFWMVVAELGSLCKIKLTFMLNIYILYCISVILGFKNLKITLFNKISISKIKRQALIMHMAKEL